MILATCQHHNLKPYTFQSEFRIVYCCLVELSFHMIIFCKKQFCVVSILLSLSEYTDALGPIVCI